MAINRYTQIIEQAFLRNYKEGDVEVSFKREDIALIADQLGIPLPKNLGDIVYSFRYRSALPQSIKEKASEGYEWIIRSGGTSQYKFVLTKTANIIPNPNLA